MPIYDLRPGELVETDEPLSVDELDRARKDFEKGKSLAKIAAALGGRIPEQQEKRPMVGVYLDTLLDQAALGGDRDLTDEDERRLAKWIGDDHAKAMVKQLRHERGQTDATT